MAKIVVYNLPAHGHVNPSLGLVRSLIERGYEIHYFCSEEFRERIEDTGAVFKAIPHEFNPQYASNFDVLQVVYDVLGQGSALIPDLLADFEEELYDYIICDFMAVWGRYISMLTGKKTIQLYPIFAGHVQIKQPLAFFWKLFERPFHTIAMFAKIKKLSKEISKKYEVPYMDMRELLQKPIPNAFSIVFTCRAFQPKQQLFLEKDYAFIGASLDESRAGWGDFPVEWLQKDKPLVLVSLGSIVTNNLAFFKTAVDAFKGSDFQVVMSVGNYIDPAALNLPENLLALPYIPQVALLNRATVFINHGGMNSVVEGICAQVPLLVIPQVSDQFQVANQVEINGLGVWLKTKISPKLLLEKCLWLSGNKAVQHHLETICQRFKEAGGAEKGAEAAILFFTEEIN